MPPIDIIDAHQHFWDIDANYLPWLCDPAPIPFRYGDYSALRRNYMPDDYRRDAAGFNLIGSVFVETEWDPRDPRGEVEWVRTLRAGHGLPSVMVAQAWLDRADAAELLAVYGETDFVRGIRHKPRAAARPQDIEAGAPGSMSDPRWREGYARLTPNGLSFDLQTPWWHLAGARRLADDFPDTLIIINHTGLPADRSAEGLAGWKQAMQIAAAAGNVVLKISGIGQAAQPWSVAGNREIVLAAIDMFGVDRVMFASNFPVDSLVGGFDTIFGGFLEITADFADAERSAMFAGNARKFYRLPTNEGHKP